ncbi:MAG: hypothetical protein HKN39_01265 [Flavobacteriales bacterium]|nr:hypothetical protein [Flavobacteriales bacterium]
MIKNLLIVAFLAISFSIAGQEDYMDFEFRERFREANLLMQEENFDEASDIWMEKVNNHTENANLNYKTGYALLNSSKDRKSSLQYLKIAEQLRGDKFSNWNINDYDPFDPQEVNAPIETPYYLAKSYLLNGDFEEALNNFNKANELLGNKHHLKDDCLRYIETTKNAIFFTNNPIPNPKIVNLGEKINGKYDDFSPVLSLDERALYFTSRRARSDSSNVKTIAEDGKFYEDIYISYKDVQGEWGTPELLNINEADKHLATVNVSPDGQQLYVYDGSIGDGTLKESKMIGELWSEPVKLGTDINSKHWETHITLTPDGNTMYFVSDRPGGHGERDIYRVVKLPNGKWSKALCLPKEVNTKYNEDAPYIHPDGRTLYFASEGHKSMGGFDIFKTDLNDDGQWSIPENIGYPINTVEDDVFYVMSPDRKRAYFSSDRVGGFGKKDVYRIDLPTPPDEINLAVLKGAIESPEELPDDIAIYVTNTSTDVTKSYKPRARDGVFVAILEPCNDYDIDYTINGISIKQETISVDCGSSYREINREILLDPVNLANSKFVDILVDVDPKTGKTDDVDKQVGSTTTSDDGTVVQTKTSDDDVTVISTSKDDVTVVSTSEVGTVFFDVYYGYNQTGTDLDKERFEIFVEDVVELIEQKGNIDITLEGSASRVPTKTWGTNEKLARARVDKGKENLLTAIQAKGVDINKLNIKTIDSSVQGPIYSGDYKNIEKYTKYQFLKITGK